MAVRFRKGKDANHVSAGSSVILTLPWPPTMNTYWRNVANKTLISKEGRDYRRAVVRYVVDNRDIAALRGRLAVSIVAYQPDKRQRDLDNLLKAPLDALEKAGVYLSDSQIDALSIRREYDKANPCLVVTIVEIR